MVLYYISIDLYLALMSLLLIPIFILNLLRSAFKALLLYEVNPIRVTEPSGGTEPTAQTIAPRTVDKTAQVTTQPPTIPTTSTNSPEKQRSSPSKMAVPATLLCPFCDSDLSNECNQALRVHIRRCLVKHKVHTCPGAGCDKNLTLLSWRSLEKLTAHLRGCTLICKTPAYTPPKPKAPKKIHFFVSTNPAVPSIIVTSAPEPARKNYCISKKARYDPGAVFNTEKLYPPPTTSKGRLNIHAKGKARYPWLAESVAVRERLESEERHKRSQAMKQNDSPEDRKRREFYRQLKQDKLAEKYKAIGFCLKRKLEDSEAGTDTKRIKQDPADAEANFKTILQQLAQLHWELFWSGNDEAALKWLATRRP